MAPARFAIHSQCGEDGLLLHIFSKIGVTDRRFVEFGIGDPERCNSANLVRAFGWSGLLIECDRASIAAARVFFAPRGLAAPPPITLVEALISRENVNQLIGGAGFEGTVDLLSLDIDGNDYWVWKAQTIIRPRLVVIEYNATFGATERLITRYDPRFSRFAKHETGYYYGASLAALAALGRSKGYRLAGCESGGLNAFFLRDDVGTEIFPELTSEEAFCADAKRARRHSQEEQLRAVAHLGFEDDEPGPAKV